MNNLNVYSLCRGSVWVCLGVKKSEIITTNVLTWKVS